MLGTAILVFTFVLASIVLLAAVAINSVYALGKMLIGSYVSNITLAGNLMGVVGAIACLVIASLL